MLCDSRSGEVAKPGSGGSSREAIPAGKEDADQDKVGLMREKSFEYEVL